MMLVGRLFHARATVTRNDRSPMVLSRVHGTIRRGQEPDRSRCRDSVWGSLVLGGVCRYATAALLIHAEFTSIHDGILSTYGVCSHGQPCGHHMETQMAVWSAGTNCGQRQPLYRHSRATDRTSGRVYSHFQSAIQERTFAITQKNVKFSTTTDVSYNNTISLIFISSHPKFIVKL